MVGYVYNLNLDCSIIHTNLRIEIEQFKHENSEDQSIVDSILDSITDLSAKIPHEKSEAITKLVKSIRSRNVFIDKNNKLITQIDNDCGKIVKKLQDNKPKIATMYNTITRYNKKSKTYFLRGSEATEASCKLILLQNTRS